MSGATDHAGLRHAPGRAVLYMLVAIAMLALLDAGVKWLTADYAVPQIAFIRYLFGIALAIRLVPGEVLAECRPRAAAAFADGSPTSRRAARVIVAVWAGVLLLAPAVLLRAS